MNLRSRTEEKKIIEIKEKSIIFGDGEIEVSPNVVQFLKLYKSGDKVKVNIYDEKIIFMKKTEPASAPAPAFKSATKVDEMKEKGYIYLKGKWYATYKVLLNSLHEKYKNIQIKTDIIEINTTEKRCIMKAEIIADKNIFTGFGDVSSDNVSKEILSSYIRMAETRAVCRALRLATNIGETSIEELPEE